MNELVGPWPGSLVTGDDAQGRELADRLETSAPLAFRSSDARRETRADDQ